MDRTSLCEKLPERPDGGKIGRGEARTGEEHMPRFVKLASLNELPVGAAREVGFEGRV